METGWQWISCDEDHDHGSQIWTGVWPGEAECREFGWLTPEGGPDLNRLMANAQGGWVVWNKTLGRWVHRPMKPYFDGTTGEWKQVTP